MKIWITHLLFRKREFCHFCFIAKPGARKPEVQTQEQTLIYWGDTSQEIVNSTDTCSRAMHPTNAQMYLLQMDGTCFLSELNY